jgi:hypothetical protein
MAKTKAELGELETAAAIAWNMGSSNRWRLAYNAAADSMGGFPGFYQASVEMALSLEKYAKAKNIEWGQNADWLLTTEAVAEEILKFMIANDRIPDESERTKIVKKNIKG